MNRIILVLFAIACFATPAQSQTSVTNENFNFAERAKQNIKNDKKTCGSAFLGVISDGISKSKATALGFDNPYGSYVSEIVPGTAAEKADFKPFDYIVGIDNYRVGAEQSLSDILRKYDIGDKAFVHAYRKGKKGGRKVTFGSRDDVKYQEKKHCEKPFLGIEQRSNDTGFTGVRVSPVSYSTAADAGMQPGDVIYSLNGHQMVDWQDITIALKHAEVNQPITICYMRDGQTNTVQASLKSYNETKNAKYAAQKESCESKCKSDKDSKHKTKTSTKTSTYSYTSNEEDHKTDHNHNHDYDHNHNHSTSSTTTVTTTVTASIGAPDVSDLGGQNSLPTNTSVQIGSVNQQEITRLNTEFGIGATNQNDLSITNLDFEKATQATEFELRFGLPRKGDTHVKVYNNHGRAIYDYELSDFSGAFEDVVDLGQNGLGTYFISIVQDDKSTFRKVVLK